jgi:hypothetical protein
MSRRIACDMVVEDGEIYVVDQSTHFTYILLKGYALPLMPDMLVFEAKTKREPRPVTPKRVIPDHLYTLDDVATKLCISAKAVRNLTNRGQIPGATQVDGKMYWDKVKINTFAQELKAVQL